MSEPFRVGIATGQVVHVSADGPRKMVNIIDDDGIIVAAAHGEAMARRIVEALNATAPTP